MKSTSVRAFVRVALCVAFVVSLYGGLSFLTIAMFIEGHLLLGLVSGLILSGITATLAALCGLAWSMAHMGEEEDPVGLSVQPA